MDARSEPPCFRSERVASRHDARDPDVVCIDSSVFFAASMSARGFARDLLVAGLRGTVHLIISSLVLEETERNLRARAPRALPAFEILLCAERKRGRRTRPGSRANRGGRPLSRRSRHAQNGRTASHIHG